MQKPRGTQERAERSFSTRRMAGEPPYVAYFWRRRSKRSAIRAGDIFLFTVSSADVGRFSELAGVDVVALRETDGLVHETSAEDALRDGLRGR